MEHIRLLLLVCLLGIGSSGTKHRRQLQQPTFIIPPSSFGSFAPNIQVQDGSHLVQVPPNKEPTVVFARITIPKSNEQPQHQSQQYQDPNNFLIQSQPVPQPLPTFEVDPLTPTTYRPPPSELVREVEQTNIDPVTQTQHQVVNLQSPPEAQPQIITYYSDPPSHQHISPGNGNQVVQFVSTGLRHQSQVQPQGQGQLLATPPSHFIQHFTTVEEIQPQAGGVFPNQPYHPHSQHVSHYPVNGVRGSSVSLGGALSSAANLIKSTASKMTEYVPSFIKINHKPNYAPVRIPGFEVNTLTQNHRPVQYQEVSYNKVKTGKKRIPPTSQYYPYSKKYTAKEYAGSMLPPSRNPAPVFYTITEPEPKISYPTYFVNSQLSPQNVVGIDQEQMQTSQSVYNPIIMRRPTRVRVKVRRIPKRYYFVKNSSSPAWTITSHSDPMVQAFNTVY